MKHYVASGNSLLQGCGIAQISGNAIGFEVVNIFRVATGTHQQAQIASLVGESTGYMAADKTCSASEECEHFGPNLLHFVLSCDATMYHMTKASVRDLRYRFREVEDLLRQGQEIQITKRKRVIARLVPENDEKTPEIPDFLARLKKIYGKPLKVTGAEIISKDREDRF